MNRTDRLVAMVMFLQGRRVVKAEELATHFEVTVRTIYRDVSALGEAGVPVVGEAGVGYSLVRGYHLPPIMFTAEEAMALFVGGEFVKQFGDASMAPPMDSALLKIRSVLPRDRQDDVDRLAQATAIYGSRLPSGIDQRILLPIQQAIVGRRLLRMRYRGKGRTEDTARDVEPLGVTYHGGAWYLVGWCRLRADYRYFKLERVQALEVLTERFAARPEFALRDFMKREMNDVDRLEARVWLAREAMERARKESYTEIIAEHEARGGFEVRLRTSSYEWLARWLLSFGGGAEALAPAKLRTLVRTAAEAVLAQHRE